MSFGQFLAILQCITSKKLQKLPQNWTSKKKVSTEIAKNAKFFFSTSHKSPKYVQKIKIFLPNNVTYPYSHRKNFYRHRNNIREMNLRFLKKKRFYRNQDEVEPHTEIQEILQDIYGECQQGS